MVPFRSLKFRLTVGDQGNSDLVLFSSSKCVVCVLDLSKIGRPDPPLADSFALPHFVLLRVDAAWPRGSSSRFGLMSRCRAQP
jgi:hypothetical protein